MFNHIQFLGFFGGQRMIQGEPGAIVGPIAAFFGFIIDAIFNAVYFLTVNHALGFSVILLTIIMRSMMLPLAVKQQKSMMAMSALQPEIEKIKKKYGNSKDPEIMRKQNAEIQAFMTKNNINPLKGCLPMFIQMPLFFGIAFIMNQLYLYVSQLGQVYSQISHFFINLIPGHTNYIFPVADPLRPGNMVLDLNQESHMNRILNSFGTEDWNQLLHGNPTLIGGLPHEGIPAVYHNIPAEHLSTLMAKVPAELIEATAEGYTRLEHLRTVGDYVQNLLVQYPIPVEMLGDPTLLTLFEQKSAIENFFGMAMTEASGLGWPGIMIPILAVLTTLATSFLMTKTNRSTDDKVKMQQRIMMIFMPIMMGFMTIGLPAGVGIFWITSNVYQVAQQAVLNKRAGIPLIGAKAEEASK